MILQFTSCFLYCVSGTNIVHSVLLRGSVKMLSSFCITDIYFSKQLVLKTFCNFSASFVVFCDCNFNVLFYFRICPFENSAVHFLLYLSVVSWCVLRWSLSSIIFSKWRMFSWYVFGLHCLNLFSPLPIVSVYSDADFPW